MARKQRNSDHVVSDAAEDPRQEHIPGADQPAAEPKPALTTEQLQALFADYDAANAELEQVKQTIEAAAQRRSAAVRAIVEAVGNKGPWNIGGVRMSVTERGGKFHITRESDAKLTL